MSIAATAQLPSVADRHGALSRGAFFEQHLAMAPAIDLDLALALSF
jgi:hypothetical protein